MSKNKLQYQEILTYQNSSWIIFGFIFFLLGLIFLLLSYFVDSDAWYLHRLFCILTTIIIFIHFLKNLKQLKKIFFLDLRYTFTLSFWFYFIFGSSLLAFANDETIDLAMSYYHIDLNLALKANSMNAIGFSIVIMLVSVFIFNWPIKIINTLKKEIKYFDPSNHRLLLIILFICIFSLIYTALESLNYIERGGFSGLSRVFKYLGVSYYFLSIYYKGNYYKFINIISFFYLLFFFVNGLILFNKLEILLPVLLILVKYAVKKKSIKLILIFFFIILIFFQIFGNYTKAKREGVLNDTSIFTGNFKGWNRLNYTNSQGAAINFYDGGDPGKSLKNILWIFVPRIFNKDKPNINEFTQVFYNKISALSGSSDSSGVFIEGYYNFGWIGLLASSLLVGLSITIYKAMIYTIIRNKLYALYFLIFAGHLTSFRIDGMILADYLGTLVIIIYILIFLIVLLFFIRMIKNYVKNFI